MEKVVIIGNGIAGITAARHIRKISENELVVISYETEFFYSRTALMYVFMGHMRFVDIQPYEPWFWEKNRIGLMQDKVIKIDSINKNVSLQSGKIVGYDKLIIATGSKPNKFGWKGQDLKGVQGLYSKQDLDLMEDNVKAAREAVIIGGGLIGVEMAEMLLSRGIKVTFIIRERDFWGNVLPKEDAALIAKHLALHQVKLIFKDELEEIIGDDNGRVKEIITKNGITISCQIVGLTVGVSPNIDFLKASDIEIERGVLVDEYMQTNQNDIYAIGDCAQFKSPVAERKSIEQVWYTGRIMGETVAQTICGNPMKYAPGPWFNSAKFFDIEYQTYGIVLPEKGKEENSFYWKHPTKEIALHLVWDIKSGIFKGINVYGIRVRHELFDKWLREKATIRTVVENLKTANFDPELYRSHEEVIITAFNQETAMNLQLQKKRWWQTILNN